MRKTLFGFLFLLVSLLFTLPLSAQTRVLVGPAGGDLFDNYYGGVTAGIEIPFAKRYEVDVYDEFSPLEAHQALGHGWANEISVGGYVWFHPLSHWGLNGGAQDSRYSVTTVSKAGDFFTGGLAYRGNVGGLPATVSFDYLQQFNNGITSTGVETSHLKGASINPSVRFGCVSAFCIRTDYSFVVGHVLTQGNPVCDGTFGSTGGPNGGPCPRQGAFSGGFSASLLFEFPRRRGHEDALF